MRRLACGLTAMLLISAVGFGNAHAAHDEITSGEKVVVGAPGRIEGSEEPVAIGVSITGIVKKVTVRQGDSVSRGELLAQIDCRDIDAQLAARDAEYRAADAYYRKLVNGPRADEIKIAEAELKLAIARLEEAQLRARRSSTLLTSNSGSRATHDIDERDFSMAGEQVNAARFRLRLLKAGTREEELTEARYKMFAAQHTIDATRAELAKCEIRSPLDGIVLRKEVSVGELVSVYYPKPLLVLSKIDRYRIRAEVDEHDITKIRLGQNAIVMINGSQRIRLHGKISEIAPVMGRRKILTSDPADKSDRDVMEVIIDLDKKPKSLPIGLRVSVIFLKP